MYKPPIVPCTFCQFPEAPLLCENCGDPMCFECAETVDGRELCPDCVEDIEEEDEFNIDNYSEERDRESRFDKE